MTKYFEDINVNIDVLTANNTSIEIFDVLGKNVYSKSLGYLNIGNILNHLYLLLCFLICVIILLIAFTMVFSKTDE